MAKELKELHEQARSLAPHLQPVAVAVEDVALGFEGWRGIGKIDFSESEKAAQQKASDVVSEAVARSKMEVFSAFAESGKVLKAFEELLKG